MYRRCGFRYERNCARSVSSALPELMKRGGALAGGSGGGVILENSGIGNKDSKQLLPELRQEIYDELVSCADIFWSVGIVDPVESTRSIFCEYTKRCGSRSWADRNTRARAHRRTSSLAISAAANRDHRWRLHRLSIAAASVIAKVTIA
jgi:ribonuclease HII